MDFNICTIATVPKAAIKFFPHSNRIPENLTPRLYSFLNLKIIIINEIKLDMTVPKIIPITPMNLTNTKLKTILSTLTMTLFLNVSFVFP